MINDVCQLNLRIEQTRKKMVVLASHTSINNQDVISISKELDKLINYHILLTMKQ
ncbi:aspartyl-phosphate phosphatase Spo0E family protein [Bacillus sp. JJ722]|uniref:aspartyl-phosphate phosphatase Spo0E family protein n=1 Tax=Bacillus sp. JJ722 TaxID=3122973 RepID=UPI002FFE3BF0